MPATKTKTSTDSWTCARCDVKIRYLPGHEPTGPPTGWTEDAGATYCLACRREIAAEEGFANAPEGMPMEQRAKLRASAVVEFEIRRAPDRPNGEIARIARCSVPAVVKMRKHLEGDSN